MQNKDKLDNQKLADDELAAVSGGIEGYYNVYLNHTVQKGETLSDVAVQYGVDYDVLLQVNSDNITDPDNLQEGMVVKVPIRG